MGWGSNAVTQSTRNHTQNPLDISHHIVVPKPQDVPTLRFKPSRSSRITSHVICMLTTVQFYGQSLLNAREIQNVNAHRMLSPKACAIQLAVA